MAIQTKTDVPRILIVDDEPRFRDSIKILLDNLGYAVQTAGSGTEAQTSLGSARYDLVLLDVVIPDQTGYDIMKPIKSRYHGTAVIILTGLASIDGADRCLQEGAVDYLRKPFDPEELLKRVEGALVRKEIERETARTQHIYREMVEQSAQGFFILQHGRVLFANAAVTRITGYTLQELRAKSSRKLQEIVHPHDLSRIRRYMTDLIEGRETSETFEYRILDSKGSLRWLEQHSSLITFLGERAAQAVVVDVSDRKRIEQALRRTQEYAQHVIDSSLDMIVAVDRDRKIVEFNRSAQEAFGYDKDEILGKSVQSLYADEAEGLLVSEAVRQRGKFVGPIKNVRKNGQVFPTLLSASLIRDNNGDVIGIVGNSCDVSEIQKVEDALRESEQLFRTIVETAPCMLMITDKDGDCVYASPNTEEIMGYTPEELIEQRIWWVHEDDTPRVMEVYNQSLQSGRGAKNFEYKAIRKGGQIRHLSCSWESVEDKEGNFKGEMVT